MKCGRVRAGTYNFLKVPRAYHERKSMGHEKKFGRVHVGMYVFLKVPREVLGCTRIIIESLRGLKRSLEGYA